MPHTFPLTITDEQHKFIKKQKKKTLINFNMQIRKLIQKEVDKAKK